MRVAAGIKAGDLLAIAVLTAAPFSLLEYGYRDSILHFFGWVIPAMLAWAWLVSQRVRLAERPTWIFWLVFFLVRAPWFSTLPVLSDDFYRFIWDGQSWLKGIHGFAYTPETHPFRNDIPFNTLFPKLNSPSYFTIYPAPSQACFALAAWVGGNDLFGSILVLRVIWIGLEAGGMYVLRRIEQQSLLKSGTAWAWMLFPILIQEGVGNLHSELPAITGLAILAAGMYRQSGWMQFSGLTMAIQFKLVPMLLLGCAFTHFPWPKRLRWAVFTLLVNMVLIGGLLYTPGYAQHFLESIRLYAETFRFHAAPFELASWLSGADISVLGNVMRLLSLMTIGAITFWVLHRRDKLPFAEMATILAVYWLGSPVIHPWYLLLPVFMQLFVSVKWAWGWIIVSLFSYMAYMALPSWLHTTGLIIEFSGLALAILIAILASGWKRQ